MSQDYKKIIQREYLNCVKSPVHFMKKYCKIQHPTKGKITISMASSVTGIITEGRYNYDILLTNTNNNNITKVITGQITVNQSISV